MANTPRSPLKSIDVTRNVAPDITNSQRPMQPVDNKPHSNESLADRHEEKVNCDAESECNKNNSTDEGYHCENKENQTTLQATHKSGSTSPKEAVQKEPLSQLNHNEQWTQQSDAVDTTSTPTRLNGLQSEADVSNSLATATSNPTPNSVHYAAQLNPTEPKLVRHKQVHLTNRIKDVILDVAPSMRKSMEKGILYLNDPVFNWFGYHGYLTDTPSDEYVRRTRHILSGMFVHPYSGEQDVYDQMVSLKLTRNNNTMSMRVRQPHDIQPFDRLSREADDRIVVTETDLVDPLAWLDATSFVVEPDITSTELMALRTPISASPVLNAAFESKYRESVWQHVFNGDHHRNTVSLGNEILEHRLSPKLMKPNMASTHNCPIRNRVHDGHIHYVQLDRVYLVYAQRGCILHAMNRLKRNMRALSETWRHHPVLLAQLRVRTYSQELHFLLNAAHTLVTRY